MKNPEHLRVQAKDRRDHIWKTLVERGYTEDEIQQAASGRVVGSGIPITEDGETPTPESWYLGALAEIRSCDKALQRGEIDAAAVHLAEALTYQSLAQINRDGPDTERGRAMRPGRREGALSPFTKWLRDYLEHNPTASNAEIKKQLRYYEPRAKFIAKPDSHYTGLTFDGKPVSKQQLRDRARECRKLLGIK